MFSKDAPKDNAELIVLSLLSAGPMYGYAISKEIATRSENSLRLTPGVLYPMLKELERDGLVDATLEQVRSERREGDEASPGRPRKWYKLTAKGRRRLESKLAAHRAMQALVGLFIPGRERGKEASR